MRVYISPDFPSEKFKDLFYLQDLYDLLYEKGAGIDFPMAMNYRAEGQQSSRAERREELKVKGELNNIDDHEELKVKAELIKDMIRENFMLHPSRFTFHVSSFMLHPSRFTSTNMPYFYFLNGHGDATYYAKEIFKGA